MLIIILFQQTPEQKKAHQNLLEVIKGSLL